MKWQKSQHFVKILARFHRNELERFKTNCTNFYNKPAEKLTN